MVVGSCAGMCPASEIDFRRRNNLVHILECRPGSSTTHGTMDRTRMVKEYRRPAAGREQDEPRLLRPPTTLVSTVNYLLDLWDKNKERNANERDLAYGFVQDRLRAVRQDLIIQSASLTAEELLDVLGAQIPFYVSTAVSCRDLPAYDWKLHATQLEECYQRWFDVASDVSKVDEQLIAGFVLHSAVLPHALQLAVELQSKINDDKTIWDLVLSLREGNYVRFVRSMARLPEGFLRAAAAVHLPRLRREALRTVAIAYKFPTSRLSLEKLTQWLGFSNISHLKLCLNDLKVPIEDDCVKVIDFNVELLETCDLKATRWLDYGPL